MMMLSSVPAVWLWRAISRAEALTKGRKAFTVAFRVKRLNKDILCKYSE